MLRLLVSLLLTSIWTTYGQVTLSSQQLHDALQNGVIDVLLDVRTQKEWDAGHIDNATHILNLSNQGVEPTKIIGCKDSCSIAVYCRTGAQAGNSIQRLINEYGFDPSNLYNGQGVQQWQDAGFTLVNTDEVPPPCNEPDYQCKTTSKPTNMLTANPSNNPTNNPTGQPSVSPSQNVPMMKVDVTIKFDAYPNDISWSLMNTCDDVPEVVGSGGNYGRALSQQAVTESFSTPAGTFELRIEDSYGDGLCCLNGDGNYSVEMNEVKLFRSKLEGPSSGATREFGAREMCPGYESDENVRISIKIDFDKYPEDISWELLYTSCDGDAKTLGEGGGYGQDDKNEAFLVYSERVPDGQFMFVIKDSFGDGLCCNSGNGAYLIYYEDERIPSDFKMSSEETQTFGSPDACGPRGGKAAYDSALGVPKCGSVDPSGSCSTAGTGLLNCKKISKERDGPNTLDTCADGDSGVCKQDESVEDITVTSSSGKLASGHTAKITATVYTFGDGTADQADFYYAINPGPNPTWIFLSSAKPSAGGKVVVESDDFELSSSEMQAVRVNMRWTETALLDLDPQPCSSGKYDDVDDLVFAVEPAENAFLDCMYTAGDGNGANCPSGQFCKLKTGECLTRKEFWGGTCAPVEELCFLGVNEVCGCDLKTYSNECQAHSLPENVASDGTCKKGGQPPKKARKTT